MSAEDRIEAEAIRWRLAAPTMDAEGWLALTAWLEADPRHAKAYDHIAQSELDGDMLIKALDDRSAFAAQPVDVLPPANDRRSAFRIGGMAIAAGLLAVIGGAIAMHRAPVDRPSLFVTAPGQSRTIRLDDGSTIALNGGSRIEVEGSGKRRVSLREGEAYFTVAHRADQPFELTVGSTTIRDIGTSFNVSRDAGGFDVAVRDGSVAVDPDRSRLILAAGQGARIDMSGARAFVSPVNARAVGSWRTGNLVFEDAPLPKVAMDVGRSLGMRIEVDPALVERHFSGTIQVSTDAQIMTARLNGLLGVETVISAGGWQFRSAARAIR